MFDWAVHLEAWSDFARLEAHTPSRVRAEQFRPGTYTHTRVEAAVNWAITDACVDQRRQTPWYFPSETHFVRWVTVMASRHLVGALPTRRIALPLLELELGQPCASLVAFWRCDSFRSQDLANVFDMPVAEVMQRLRDCMSRWDNLPTRR